MYEPKLDHEPFNIIFFLYNNFCRILRGGGSNEFLRPAAEKHWIRIKSVPIEFYSNNRLSSNPISLQHTLPLVKKRNVLLLC